jgi:hypothetical protein
VPTYFISAQRRDPAGRVQALTVHAAPPPIFDAVGHEWLRATVLEAFALGATFSTLHADGHGGLVPGWPVGLVDAPGGPFLRLDGRRLPSDDLGALPGLPWPQADLPAVPA